MYKNVCAVYRLKFRLAKGKKYQNDRVSKRRKVRIISFCHYKQTTIIAESYFCLLQNVFLYPNHPFRRNGIVSLFAR